MKSGVFYFSGAGNSEAVAKVIVQKMNIDICKKIGDTIEEDLDGLNQIGLVFPVYYFAPPTKVYSFIKNILGSKIHNIEYLFVIMTHGGMSFYTPSITERILEEAGYVASYTQTIRMVDTFTPLTKIPSKNKQNIVSKKAYEQVLKIVDDLKTQEIMVKARLPLSNLAYRLYKRICEWRYNYDKKFIVDDRCTSCGVCVQKCPVQNIVLQGKNIEYLHHCEQCFACYHHCPTHAITLKKRPPHGYSYYKGPAYFATREENNE